MSGKKQFLNLLPAICLLSAATPAFAGFEWTPPAQSQTPQIQTEPTMPAPIPSIEVDIEQELVPAEKMQMPALDNSLLKEELKEKASPAEKIKLDDEPLVGFGNDIPLVLAMRQIVPPSYAFSFDKDVDQSMRVNWSGGRPWHVVLENMLFGADLGLVISENRIWVRDEASLLEESGAHKKALQQQTNTEIKEQSAPKTPLPVMKQKGVEQAVPSEPLDIIMKSKARPERKQGAMVYKKPAQEPEATPAIPYNYGYEENIDYQAVSAKNEKSYNPSYPRRTPFKDEGDDVAKSEEAIAQPEIKAQDNAPVPLSKYKQNDLSSAAPAPVDSVPAKNTFSSDLQEKNVEMKTPIAPDFPGKKTMTSAQEEGASQVIGFNSSIDPYDIHFWEAAKGDSLRETLARWSEQAGVEMFWGAHYDYHLSTSINMHGSFADAVKSVLMIYENIENRPVGRLHPNLPDGPPVLVIESVASPPHSF